MKNIIYILVLLVVSSCGKIKEEPTNFKPGDPTYWRPFEGNITYYTNTSPRVYPDADGGRKISEVPKGAKLTYKGIEKRPSIWIGKRGLKALVVISSGKEGWIYSDRIDKRFDFSKGFHMASVFEYIAAMDLTYPLTFVFLFFGIVLWFCVFKKIKYDDYESVGFLYLLSALIWGFWGIMAVLNQDLFLTYLYEPLQHLTALFVYIEILSLIAPIGYLIFLIKRKGFTKELIVACLILPFILFTSFALAALMVTIFQYVSWFFALVFIVLAVLAGGVLGGSGGKSGAKSRGYGRSGSRAGGPVEFVYGGSTYTLYDHGYPYFRDEYGNDWVKIGENEYKPFGDHK